MIIDLGRINPVFGCLEVVYCSSGFESTPTEKKQGQSYSCGVLITTNSGLTCCFASEQPGIRIRLFTTRKIPYLDKEKVTTYRKRSLSYGFPRTHNHFNADSSLDCGRESRHLFAAFVSPAAKRESAKPSSS